MKKIVLTNGRVFAKFKRASTVLVVEIEDTGKGIEPKFVLYVFATYESIYFKIDRY